MSVIKLYIGIKKNIHKLNTITNLYTLKRFWKNYGQFACVGY
jgi:hypothetical protein